MKIIGLTGGSGSGKTAVSKVFSENGIYCIDADKVVARLYEDEYFLQLLTRSFGEKIMCDGVVKKSLVSKLVFENKEELQLLNEICLPYVISKLKNTISNEKARGIDVVCLDGATIIESGFYKECDVVVAVSADYDMRLDRITKRDNVTTETAKNRIAAQPENEFYEKYAHIVIKNDCGFDDFIRKAKTAADIIMSLNGNHGGKTVYV